MYTGLSGTSLFLRREDGVVRGLSDGVRSKEVEVITVVEGGRRVRSVDVLLG